MGSTNGTGTFQVYNIWRINRGMVSKCYVSSYRFIKKLKRFGDNFYSSSSWLGAATRREPVCLFQICFVFLRRLNRQFGCRSKGKPKHHTAQTNCRFFSHVSEQHDMIGRPEGHLQLHPLLQFNALVSLFQCRFPFFFPASFAPGIQLARALWPCVTGAYGLNGLLVEAEGFVVTWEPPTLFQTCMCQPKTAHANKTTETYFHQGKKSSHLFPINSGIKWACVLNSHSTASIAP